MVFSSETGRLFVVLCVSMRFGLVRLVFVRVGLALWPGLENRARASEHLLTQVSVCSPADGSRTALRAVISLI